MLLRFSLTQPGIHELQTQNHPEERKRIENKFIVPYQENSQFTGREQFLEMLKEKFFTHIPKQDNHRIALYGMGGIGKTQTALGYVYANRDYYDRIYWISGTDQASLLSGFRKIAENAGLFISLNSTSVEVAEIVLTWLRQEQKWLVVIDNLDDISVAEGFLPENGPEKHTLITTRNRDSAGIPATGIEVPVLDLEDAIALLSTLSNIEVLPQSTQRKEAEEILKESGYLPLAIEQAAAYIREVTGEFTGYLNDYRENHKDLLHWMPAGNRPSSYRLSVATTWSMSFKIIRDTATQAANLLRLLAFLNPDCILIEFLQSGAACLGNGLREVVSSRIHLAKTLLELEKFSFIKWNRRNKTLFVHRLVQTVVKDEMSDGELGDMLTAFINLCNESFPIDVTDETRELCRVYQGQLVGPLLRLTTIQTKEAADIMARVARFLSMDGKFSDGEKLWLQVVKIRTQILGTDHCDTLRSMTELASTYLNQERVAEAASLHEEVLEQKKRVLGKDHPATLRSMSGLALTYNHQGHPAAAASFSMKCWRRRRRFWERIISTRSLAWATSP